MIEFVALLEARGQTAAEARSALPGAPVRPDATPPAADASIFAGRAAALRLRIGAGLRRLADRIEPAPARRPAATC